MSKRLPFLALMLSYTVLAALTSLAYLNLSSPDPATTAATHQNLDALAARHHGSILRASLSGAGAFASKAVQSLNFPGMVGEVVASMLTRTWPDSWRPRGFGDGPAGLFVWRGFIFPIYCLPFWWFGGLGIDAFRRRCRLHWSEYLLGTLLAAFFAFILIGLASTTHTRSYDDMTFVFLGLAPWTVLYTIFPIAWWRSRHTPKTGVAHPSR